VILVLMVATNFVAWMEPLVSLTAGVEEIVPMQLRLSLGACITAAALVTATWLAGRHSFGPLPPALARPRLTGFRIALSAAAANILLGIAAAVRGAPTPIDAQRLALVIGAAWFLFVLPAEVVSAYLTGRATARPNASSGRGPVSRKSSAVTRGMTFPEVPAGS
jgi:hypothetical protein